MPGADAWGLTWREMSSDGGSGSGRACVQSCPGHARSGPAVIGPHGPWVGSRGKLSDTAPLPEASIPPHLEASVGFHSPCAHKVTTPEGGVAVRGGSARVQADALHLRQTGPGVLRRWEGRVPCLRFGSFRHRDATLHRRHGPGPGAQLRVHSWQGSEGCKCLPA